MKIASLFSGIGGFERGILQADQGAEIVFASEFDPDSKAKHINNQPARQIYKKNFGEYPHGDITKIKSTDVPDHDILCGGFPCQAFSIAGKRRGFEDTKGTLFFEIMRIAKVKRPELLFLENVRGLLSHDQGRTFQTILRSMDDLGYDAEWQMFNSKNHGVPQNRERVFIIGHLRGANTRPIFPITDSIEEIPKKRDGDDISTGCISTRNQSGQAQWDGSTTLIAGCLTGGGHSGGHHSDMTVGLCDSGSGRKDQLRNENIAPLRANTGAGHNTVVCYSTLPRSSRSGKGGTGHLQRDDGVSYCCDANNNIAVEQPTVKRTPLKFMGRNQKNYDGDYAFTIDSCNTGGVEVDKRIRRLMPVECEKLQGFPDNWTAEGINNDGDLVKIADTNRYKCLGNAVTVPVIEFIASHIFKMIRDIS